MQFKEELVGVDKAALVDESDEVLMVRLAEGDLGAYETLYARYKNRILTFVYRYAGDRDWAEDLTQEVFLKLYRSPRSFDPRNRFVTWLFAVARNLTIDFLRRRKPVVPLVVEGEDGEFMVPHESAEGDSPMDMLLLKEMEENLQRVLLTLSDKLREVFILCAIQGLSYEEVARIVGCPPKTVSSRLSRARERFMHHIDGYLQGRNPRIV